MDAKPTPPSPRQADRPLALPAARLSDRLTEVIDQATVESRFSPTGRAVRSDGWTPERIRIFSRRSPSAAWWPKPPGRPA